MKQIALAISTLFATVALANAPAGQPAPGFEVTDLAGKPASLADYKGKTIVLEWNNFSCPFVKKHYGSGNMQALQKKYGKDVVWLVVNSTAKTATDYAAPALLQRQLRDYDAAPARYLMDTPGEMGLAYGAKVTPHMYIIDAGGKVVYNGAIDDKRSTNPEDIRTSKNYVAAALDEIRAGKPVSVSSTTPYGCSVHYK